MYIRSSRIAQCKLNHLISTHRDMVKLKLHIFRVYKKYYLKTDMCVIQLMMVNLAINGKSSFSEVGLHLAI